jgi:predicted amidohydrolase
MKICLAQVGVTPSKKENLGKVVSVINHLDAGTKLVVFPEYSMGFPKAGLSRRYVEETSEEIEGSFVGAVTSLSKEKGVAVLLPIFEKGRGRVYNTAVVITGGKVLGGYRKTKLFDAFGYNESEVFGKGSELVLFGVGAMSFGTVICYDVRFPELVKKQAMAGAHVILVPAAWYRGQMKEEQWQTLLMCRAHETTSYVVGVGNANEAFIGRSMVVSPSGIKALDLGAGESTGYFELDSRVVSDARRRLPILKQSAEGPPACRVLERGQ